VILARLFTRPSNLLVLDEPTNDLDVETLDVLEDKLREYAGTLIVVSHDRAFMDAVVNTVLVFEEGNRIVQYAGGYSDWAARGRQLAETDNPNRQKAKAATAAPSPAPAAKPTPIPPRADGKLSFKLKHELAQLPPRIDALEQEIAQLADTTNDPAFYQRPHTETQAVLARLTERQTLLDSLIARWAELESM